MVVLTKLTRFDSSKIKTCLLKTTLNLQLESHKNLVDQCIQGRGLVQINVQLKSVQRRINILDVLKPPSDYDLAESTCKFFKYIFEESNCRINVIFFLFKQIPWILNHLLKTENGQRMCSLRATWYINFIFNKIFLLVCLYTVFFIFARNV